MKLQLSKFKAKYNLDVKSTTNYSISDLTRGNYYIFDFDIKLKNGKNLQRDLVWTLQQKQELIISILKNVQLPPIYTVLYKEDRQNTKDTNHHIFKIVDGKQRLSTALSFHNNEFPIEIDGHEYYFKDFDDDAIYQFTARFSFDFRIVYEYFDKIVSDQDLIYLFEMVNFAGTQQDKTHMNDLLNSIK